MTFDPDKFIAQKQQTAFDPDAFIASRSEGANPKAAGNRPPNEPTMQVISDMDREVLQGLTFGLSDEAGAAMAALAASLTTDAKFSDAYKDIVTNVRGQQNAFREDHPIASTAAQVAGGLASGGAGIAKATAALAPKGAGYAANVLTGTTAGALEGAIAGAGFADENKLEAAKDGAMLGGLFGAVGGLASGYFSKQSIIKDELAELFKSDNRNIRLAKYMQDGAGKIKSDRLAKEAIRQGYDEGVVAVIKGASPADKVKFRKQIAILERGKEDILYGAVNVPSDVAGDSMAQRVRHIKKVNEEAGRGVKVAARRLKGQDVDFAPAVDKLLSDLDEAGVKFNPKSGVVDFKGSDFEKLDGAEDAINRVLERMRDNVAPDAFEVHRLKKYIDNNVEFGKSSGGAVGQAEGIIKDLRHNLNEALKGKFSDYDKANTIYSSTKKTLDKFDSLSSLVDIESENVNKSLGSVSRRIMSHAVSKGGVLDVIQEIDDVAAANGGKFTDNIIAQAVFADEINKVHGATARTSLHGEGQKIARGAVNAASGNTLDVAAGAIGGAYDRFRGVNNEKGIKVIKSLLSR